MTRIATIEKNEICISALQSFSSCENNKQKYTWCDVSFDWAIRSVRVACWRAEQKIYCTNAQTRTTRFLLNSWQSLTILSMSDISAFVSSKARSFTQIHECVHFLSTIIRNDINDSAFRIFSWKLFSETNFIDDKCETDITSVVI